ncbi:hypothetical protein TrLO_g14548 [Triparma laevis f. longispina]|uniref:Uncharacterized protein n=1 Tax=Triparma laevis f. longispina TaxID=1714387 RepID=A0A9W7FTM2_9STRA|nr:hypothetical protein TrLO_g14548 [Triparma laevis f. longispina]
MPRLEDDDDDENMPPKMSELKGSKLNGYQQVYLIKKPSSSELYSGDRSVLFRCGNWCYCGKVTFDFSDPDDSDSESQSDMKLKDIPRIIPMLQRQQGKLAFYCNATAVPKESDFYIPLETQNEAQDFLAAELQSDHLGEAIERFEKMYPWMDSDEVKTYFELNCAVGEDMDTVQCVCSKTYARGLIFITIYFEGTFYVSISDGYGDQPLLDVRFPDVSNHGEGITLMSYLDNDIEARWQKLTLWQSLAEEMKLSSLLAPRKKKTKNLASDSYVQSYIVLKGDGGNDTFRTAMFRFGSWCYSGRVQLTSNLALADLPHVIPALRMQQSRLEFLCDVASMPSKSPFVRPMEFCSRVAPVMESEVVESEGVLMNLVERLGNMGLGDSISQWLEGDPGQSFFEFNFAKDNETDKAHNDVELMCTKCYTPNGLVTITIYFGGVYYLSLLEGGGEQPLLDSKFPNVAGKGRGYQIRAYGSGVDNWESLRKVSIWQTSEAMQKEMEERIGKASESKSTGGEDFAGAVEQREERNAKMVDDELRRSMEEADIGGGGNTVAESKSEVGGGEERGREREREGKGGEGAVSEPVSSPEPVAESKISSFEEANSPIRVSPAKEQTPDTSGLASPSQTTEAEAKKISPVSSGAGAALPNNNNNKQSLGAFHHLAPMRKPSGLEGKLGDIRKSMGGGGGLGPVGGGGLGGGGALGSAPWDPFGKPVLGKKEAKPL